MAQVGTRRADSPVGVEEEAGMASVGFQGYWSPVCIRQGAFKTQERSLHFKNLGVPLCVSLR